MGARPNRGFTLIEVVVSLAILSLVLLGTVTGLRTLGNTQESLERVTDRAEEVRTVRFFEEPDGIGCGGQRLRRSDPGWR